MADSVLSTENLQNNLKYDQTQNQKVHDFFSKKSNEMGTQRERIINKAGKICMPIPTGLVEKNRMRY